MEKLFRKISDKVLLQGVFIRTAVPASSIILMFGLYNLILRNYWLSVAVSYICGCVVWYLINNKYTFTNKRKRIILEKYILNTAVCNFAAFGLSRILIDAVFIGGYNQTACDNSAIVVGIGLSTVFLYYVQRLRGFARHSEIASRNPDFTKKTCDAARKPTVTIIADDGFATDYTSLKEMVDSVSKSYPDKNIPCCIALQTNVVHRLRGMALEQARYSQNELGWEYCCHVDGTNLEKIENEEAIENKIRDSLKLYAKFGLDVNNIVYCEGGNDERVRRIARKYFNCGTTTIGSYTGNDPNGVNTGIIGSFYLKRWALGSFYQGHGDGAGTFKNDYKTAVERAITNNGWLIFMLHPNNPAHDKVQQEYFVQTIKYCIEKGVEIVTLQQGYDIFGNAVEYGDFLGSTSLKPDQGFAISKEGKISVMTCEK